MAPNLYTNQSKNIWKTYFLMALFLAIVVALGLFLSAFYGRPEILYFAVIISLVMNVGSYWFSDKIALSLSGAKEIDPVTNQEHLELKRIVENLAIAAGLPTPRIYIINDASPNAFATGRNKEHAAVAVTTGLLQILDRSELEGVIAHELAHIGNRDILLGTVVVVLVGLISIASDFFLRSALWGGMGGNREGGGRQNPILLIVGIVLIVLSPIIATIIQLAISRHREFLADSTGALITRYPEGLASALQKISGVSAEIPLARASNATAHLYISNPFGGEALKGIHKLFMTHPPVEERVKALLGKVS